MGEDGGSQRWVEAGLAALARGGIDAVRVEVVAQDLGVTKGGFYRRFKDRRALLDAILAQWSAGRVEAIERHTDLAGEAADARLREVIRLYAERRNAEGMAIELAIRQWARGDAGAASEVAKVDAARLTNVAALYARLGFTPAEAHARAVLFYAFIFGQGLLFPEASPAVHADLMASCEDVLTAGPGR